MFELKNEIPTGTDALGRVDGRLMLFDVRVDVDVSAYHVVIGLGA